MHPNGTGARDELDLERGPRTVTVAGRELTIEPPSARKASRAMAILRGVSTEAAKLINAWGRFEAEYERDHYAELPRAEAMLRYGGPQPLHREGEPVYNDAGELVTIPSGLDEMTDEAWSAVGNVLRRPRSPDTWQTATAVLGEASDDFEENIWRLLALFTISNADVRAWRKNGTLPEKIDELADELLDDAGLDELLELAAVVGDVVDSTFRAKAREIGGSRLGKALRLLGIDPSSTAPQTAPEEAQTATHGPEAPAESTATPSSSRPTSSTDSPEPSQDGPPTPSSTPTPSSSEPSAIGSSSSASRPS